MLCASPPSHKILHTQDGKNCIPPLSGTRSWENILLVHCLLSLYLFQTGGEKKGMLLKWWGNVISRHYQYMCMVGVAAGKGDAVALAADFFLLRAKRGEALGARSLRKCLDIS